MIAHLLLVPAKYRARRTPKTATSKIARQRPSMTPPLPGHGEKWPEFEVCRHQ
jgi:hypothetical protein